MRPVAVARFALSILCLGAFALTGCGIVPTRQTGIVGKWRSPDGNYIVEFTPSGKCSAHTRVQGREVGGDCTYTLTKDEITLHYPNPRAGSQDQTATWQYTLAGDALTVSVFGNSVTMKRVP
jgi:hypothetical protein